MRNVVVTRACRLWPSRSSAMVRIDVPTTVWLSDDRNIAAIRPTMTNMIWRCVMTPPASAISRARCLPRLSTRTVSLTDMGASLCDRTKAIDERSPSMAGGARALRKSLRGLQSYTHRIHFAILPREHSASPGSTQEELHTIAWMTFLSARTTLALVGSAVALAAVASVTLTPSPSRLQGDVYFPPEVT